MPTGPLLFMSLCLRALSLMPAGSRFYTQGPRPFYCLILAVLKCLAHNMPFVYPVNTACHLEPPNSLSFDNIDN